MDMLEIRLNRAFFLLTLILAHKSEETGKNMRREWKRSLFFKVLFNIEYPVLVHSNKLLCYVVGKLKHLAYFILYGNFEKNFFKNCLMKKYFSKEV